MKKKIALNVFYNLFLILAVFGISWSVNNKSPLIAVFCGAAFAAILFFKIKLIQDVRKEVKK
jgi:hypothetical protein